MPYRVYFHNLVLPTCLDCQTSDPQAAKQEAVEHLKVFFAAQNVPESIVEHFIADIQDLSLQQMEVLLHSFTEARQ